MSSFTRAPRTVTWLLVLGFVLSCPLLLGTAQPATASCHGGDGGHHPDPVSSVTCCLARQHNVQTLDTTTLTEWRLLGSIGLTVDRHRAPSTDVSRLTRYSLVSGENTSGDTPVFLLNAAFLI